MISRRMVPGSTVERTTMVTRSLRCRSAGPNSSQRRCTLERSRLPFQRLGDREALAVQRADDAEFSIDRMGRRQQFAGRLAAQHITARRRFEQIGRIGLAALELLDREGAGEAANVAGEMIGKPCRVDTQRRGNLFRAGECVLSIDRHPP